MVISLRHHFNDAGVMAKVLHRQINIIQNSKTCLIPQLLCRNKQVMRLLSGMNIAKYYIIPIAQVPY